MEVICKLVGRKQQYIELTIKRGETSIGVKLVKNELENWIGLRQYALQLAKVIGAKYVNETYFT